MHHWARNRGALAATWLDRAGVHILAAQEMYMVSHQTHHRRGPRPLSSVSTQEDSGQRMPCLDHRGAAGQVDATYDEIGGRRGRGALRR
jgi:hypothetical protein